MALESTRHGCNSQKTNMEQFELEKFVMDFFGLSDEVTENDKVYADFG